jgi:hypothetical protein
MFMARRRLNALVILAVAAATSGCITTRFTLVNPSAEPYAPVNADSVLILTDEAELDTLRYSRMAIIEATGSGEWTNQTDMLNAMRKKAGAIGANAILLPQINEPGAGAKVAAAIFGTGTQRKGNVVALRILGRKEPSDSTRATAATSTAYPTQPARPSFGPARPSALSGRPHSRTTR